MLARSVLITGASRGIGLELVKQLVTSHKPPEIIVATCRTPQSAKDLNEMAESNANVHVLKLDVCDEKTYEAFSTDVQKIVGSVGLQLLINNAGINDHDWTFADQTKERLMKHFEVNTVSPILLTRALLPTLKQATCSGEGETSLKGVCICNMSSLYGSVQKNDVTSMGRAGGQYAYRCSKAALNMATKSMSIDLKGDGIMAIAVHPGWVKTDMGGDKAPIEKSDSAESLLNIIANVTPEQNGYHLDATNNGAIMPW